MLAHLFIIVVSVFTTLSLSLSLSLRTALQYLFKATDQARTYNYYDGGLSHTWMMFYHAQLTEDGVALNEWSVDNHVTLSQ